MLFVSSFERTSASVSFSVAFSALPSPLTCPPVVTLANILQSWSASNSLSPMQPYSSVEVHSGRSVTIKLRTKVKEFNRACVPKYGGFYVRVCWRVIMHGTTLDQILQANVSHQPRDYQTHIHYAAIYNINRYYQFYSDVLLSVTIYICVLTNQH